MKTANICAIALTLLAPLPAFANDGVDPEPKQLTVSYAGLDLGSQQGVSKLYTRIRVAAKSVCRNLETLELGIRHTKWQKCINSAVIAAVADVNSPMLTAYASDRLGTELQTTVANRK